MSMTYKAGGKLKSIFRKILEAIADFAQRYNEWEYEEYLRDEEKK